jgi:hypothetical protein
MHVDLIRGSLLFLPHPLVDFLLCLTPSLRAGFGFLLLLFFLGLKAYSGEDGEMIGTEGRQNLQLDKSEMIGMEDVVEGPAQDRVFRMEGTEASSPDTRVEKTADLLKKARCIRPGNVIEVAGDDHA